ESFEVAIPRVPWTSTTSQSSTNCRHPVLPRVGRLEFASIICGSGWFMNNFQITAALVPVPTEDPSVAALRQAIAAHLARYTGQPPPHPASALRAFLAWCAARHVAPLPAHRVHVELYVRWMQEPRRYKPSTISRRLSVVAGFYRTAVIDGVLTA